MIASDADLEQQVRRELRWDAHLRETDIVVEVTAGVVTLSGTTPSAGERVVAQRAAQRVDGVVHVINTLHVKPRGRASPGNSLVTGRAHAIAT